MISESFLALPRSTSRTLQGPVIKRMKGEIIVEYDYETDDGHVEWLSIIFKEVLVLELRDSACSQADDVVGSEKIRIQTKSALLKETMERWQEHVGWQAWQQKQGGASRFKHFTIWFDDVVSLNLVASACAVSKIT